MALQYRLVQRKDMRKGVAEDSKLFFAATHTTSRVSFDDLCDIITVASSASRGDVSLILEGLILALQQQLKNGASVKIGNFGTFKMCAGSKGVEAKEDFNVSLINRPKISFYPGSLLNSLRDDAKFERDDATVVTEECTKEHVL